MISQLVRFYFAKIARYKVISFYKTNFATFRAYETLLKHIYESHTKINVNTTLMKNFVNIVTVLPKK